MIMTMQTKSRLERHLCEALRLHLTGAGLAVPEAGRVLWRVFIRLSEARAYSPIGPNPISFSEIDAWCRLMNVPLQPHHVSILRAMDVVWIDQFYARQAPAPAGVKTLSPISKQPLTAALFDVAVQ